MTINNAEEIYNTKRSIQHERSRIALLSDRLRELTQESQECNALIENAFNCITEYENKLKLLEG